MTERIETAQELTDVVSELYLVCGLLKCAWHATDENDPDPRTVEAIGQTIEFAAEKVGLAIDRIEDFEVHVRALLRAAPPVTSISRKEA